VIIRPIGSFENQAPDVYQTSFNILQARSTMGSDRSDDPPPQIRPDPLFKVHIFVSEWFH